MSIIKWYALKNLVCISVTRCQYIQIRGIITKSPLNSPSKRFYGVPMSFDRLENICYNSDVFHGRANDFVPTYSRYFAEVNFAVSVYTRFRHKSSP